MFPSMLSHPRVYVAFQAMMGANQGRRYFADTHIRSHSGDNILDMGCGTADIVEFLPNVNYWGFDVSAEYIESARRQFGDRGRFVQRQLDDNDLPSLPRFDIVLAMGLLHHVNDSNAIRLVELAYNALRIGGRLVTIDPCFSGDQTFFARFLVSHDRGQHVRHAEGYANLVLSVFRDCSKVVRHQRWVPYTHCIMESTK